MVGRWGNVEVVGAVVVVAFVSSLFLLGAMGNHGSHVKGAAAMIGEANLMDPKVCLLPPTGRRG